jgi:hypothetical protein
VSASDTIVVVEEGAVTVISVGEQGPLGPTGPQGSPGPAGQGMPPGGAVGEFLKKVNGNDYGTSWDTIDEGDVAGLTADLGAKEPAVAPGNSSQYYRGDKTWQTLNKAAVGLSKCRQHIRRQ